MKKLNLVNVILSFLKIGAIGFGGGAALIPIIESEIVEKNKWMEKKDFDVAVAAASISPASLPVSICAVWNQKYSLFSAYFYALPGPFIYMILLTGFSMIGQAGKQYITYASAGILVFVLLIIYKFIRKNYLYSKNIGITREHIIILVASFLLYSGKSVREFITGLFSLTNTLPTPLFSIAMLDLIMILFFIVCFMGISKSKIKFGITIVISLLFAFSGGKTGLLANWTLPLIILMFSMAIGSIVNDVMKNRGKSKSELVKIDFTPLRNLAFFLLVGAGLAVLTFFVSKSSTAWDLAFRGVTSSLTSFGGGEVYYAIAKETFVDTNLIPVDFYMDRILGIAGAMPGPVICSILSGVGFAYGSALGGAALGWMFGILGFSMSVTATAIGALSLFTVFRLLKDSARLKMIIMYIIPLVCGVLISVSLSLLLRASVVIAGVGLHQLLGFGIVIAMFSLMLFAHRKFKINDMILFLIGGLSTLAGLSILNAIL